MVVLRNGTGVAQLVLHQLLVLVLLHPQRRHHHHLAFATMVQMALVLHLIVREVQKEVPGVIKVVPTVQNAVDVGVHLGQVAVLLHHHRLAFATMALMALVLHLIVREVQKAVPGVTRVVLTVRNAVDVGVLQEGRESC